MIVRDFQSIIGEETRKQIIKVESKLPDLLVACVGGGSNAIGLFYPFLNDSKVKMVGVEAGGNGISSGLHSASISAGSKGVLHGSKTYLLQDKFGQINETHSVSAGLDYPGVGPEHSFLNDINRVSYKSVNDKEAIKALQYFSEKEGIIPALETAHALAFALKAAKKMKKSQSIIVNLSGRGDKDLQSVRDFLDEALDQSKTNLQLEEIHLSDNSPLIGKTIKESKISENTGVVILAIQEPGKGRIDSSEATKLTRTPLIKNHIIIALGTENQLTALKSDIR